MKKSIIVILAVLFSLTVNGQLLPGFRPSTGFGEQQMVIENDPPGTRMLVNAPLNGFGPEDRVLLVLYALPNGNTIEQTIGRKMKEGDDWHFDIQHIGAQTRFIRERITDRTVVVAYMENSLRSWPAWKSATPDYRKQVAGMVGELTGMFSRWNPEIVLNGHSGGGRFIFSCLDSIGTIPTSVVRIAFIDSDYGYEDTVYGPLIRDWLKGGKERYLCTLAYNDSVVIYNGKPLVSPTGGTWYRSRMMKNFLASSFRLKEKERDSLIWVSGLKGRIEFVFKPNPEGKIYHTQQVEYNGFIHSMMSGTKGEEQGYRYFGQRAYSDLIGETVDVPIRRLNIPPRCRDAETGSAFMARIDTLPLAAREEEIFKAVAGGNIPGFLRNMIILEGDFPDTAGVMHHVVWEVMPDYLAVGSDEDFCRVPMNPLTAQRLALLTGGSLLTAEMSDRIYETAEVRLTPFNYVPVGNENELVRKFADHNAQIEKQLAEAGGKRGQLVAGIKKDVILAARLAEKDDRVVIYGWHKPDGKPIQPVYSGHVWWYVDYSHGIRLANDQVTVDGRKCLLSELLKDPLLYRLFSDEPAPMRQPSYTIK